MTLVLTLCALVEKFSDSYGFQLICCDSTYSPTITHNFPNIVQYTCNYA